MSELAPPPSPETLNGVRVLEDAVAVAAAELAGEDRAVKLKREPEDVEPRLNFGMEEKIEPEPEPEPGNWLVVVAVDEVLDVFVVVTVGVVKLFGPWL